LNWQFILVQSRNVCDRFDSPPAVKQVLKGVFNLIFDRRSPLFREIDAYQRRRIKKLKQQKGRSF